MKGMVTVLAPDNQQVRTGTWALLVFVDSTRILWGRHLRMRCERCTRMCSRCTEYLLLTAWGAQRRKVLPRLQSYVGLASRKTLPLVVSRESDNVRGAEAQRELFFFSSWESSSLLGVLVAKLHHDFTGPASCQLFTLFFFCLRQNQKRQLSQPTLFTYALRLYTASFHRSAQLHHPVSHHGFVLDSGLRRHSRRQWLPRVVHGRLQSLTRGWEFPQTLGGFPTALGARFDASHLLWPFLPLHCPCCELHRLRLVMPLCNRLRVFPPPASPTSPDSRHWSSLSRDAPRRPGPPAALS